MRTVLIPLVALVMILGVLYVIFLQFRGPPLGFGPGGDSVLIIYDLPNTRKVRAAEMVSAESLAQLLCHFDVSIEMVSTADYKPGRIRKASYVFYMGTKNGQPLPSYLLDDIYEFRRPFMWIGANLNRLQARRSMDKYGFRVSDDLDGHLTNDVRYKDQRLAKTDLRSYLVEITRPAMVEVLVEARYVDDPIKPAEYGRDMMPGTPETSLGLLPLEAGLDILPPAREGEETLSDNAIADRAEPFSIPPAPSPPKITLPWILRAKDFWYVAGDPMSYMVEGGAYLAFADLLHDFLGQKHREDHPAFVRLEDIHAKRDPVTLRKAADFLYDRGIPFSYTLTPVYKNAETGETIYLSDAPEFQETLRHLNRRGGTAILHGYTHQATGETAVDYEFWSTVSGAPIAGNDPTFAAARVEKALNEVFLNGIYPLAWTTPHFAAGQADYEAIANYFTTVVERRMPVELFGSDQFFPYLIKSDKHHQIIIPETLGYINPAAGRDPAALLIDARAGKVVRDGWAGFFFHTFLDLNLLVELVDGLLAEGYHFVALSDFNNKVTTRGRVVVSGINEVTLALDTQYKHDKTLGRNGELLEESFSFGTVTGNIHKYVSLRPGEILVMEGVYKRPPITLANLFLFRPTISGITNPVAMALLILGMMTLLTFLFLWIYLITRKTLAGARRWMASQKEEEA